MTENRNTQATIKHLTHAKENFIDNKLRTDNYKKKMKTDIYKKGPKLTTTNNKTKASQKEG